MSIGVYDEFHLYSDLPTFQIFYFLSHVFVKGCYEKWRLKDERTNDKSSYFDGGVLLKHGEFQNQVNKEHEG